MTAAAAGQQWYGSQEHCFPQVRPKEAAGTEEMLAEARASRVGSHMLLASLTAGDPEEEKIPKVQ